MLLCSVMKTIELCWTQKIKSGIPGLRMSKSSVDAAYQFPKIAFVSLSKSIALCQRCKLNRQRRKHSRRGNPAGALHSATSNRVWLCSTLFCKEVPKCDPAPKDDH